MGLFVNMADHDYMDDVEPVKGKVLAWDNVEYFVHKRSALPLPSNCKIGRVKINPTKRKQILHSNSGVLPPGSFMAILGSSGAGKTTFLNALAQQYDDNGELVGDIRIGNDELTKKKFSTYCGYVKQQDILLPNNTVKETLDFYAHLRLPSSMSRSQRDQRVKATMKKLGLLHCADTLIGGKTKKGISGGEKRRVSVAVELIRDPTILFLDEPTSGLDSRTALSVVSTLVELAHVYNHTIICTIHQPRSQIFQLFDFLMILAKGKQIFYGQCSDSIPYFNGLGFPCPKHENPADFFIDLLTIDPSSEKTTAASQDRVQNIIESSEASPYEGVTPPPIEDSGDEELNENNEGGAGYFTQIYLLMKRTIIGQWRDKRTLIGRGAQNVVMAVMVLILFFQMDTDQTAIQDRISIIFMCLLGTTFSEAVAAALVFPLERPVYQRERDNRMYRISAYYFARQLTEFPIQLAMPSIFVCVVYFAAGLRPGFVPFLVFLIIVISLGFSINSYGLMVGAIVPGGPAALLVPSSLIIFLLAAGFYIHPDNFPTWLSWIVYIDVFYYGFNAAITNQFTDMDFYCKDDQFIEYEEVAVCPSGERVLATSSYCPITEGEQIIDRYDSDEWPIWAYIVILLGVAVFFRVITYICLRVFNPKEVELN